MHGVICLTTLFLCLVGGSQNKSGVPLDQLDLQKEVDEANNKLLTQESIEIFNEILKVLKEYEGESHKSVTHPKEEDPKLRLTEEKYKMMVNTLEERRDAFAKAYGREDRRTISTMKFLAIFLELNERHEEAREVYREIGKLSRNSLGIGHKDSLESMAALASQYTQNGNHAKAIDILRNIHDLQVESLGKTHEDTLTTLAQLAEALIAQSNNFLNKNEPENAKKRAEEAMKFSKTAYVYTKKEYGEKHPRSIEAMKNFATTLFHVQEYKRARIVMEKVYKYYAKNYGKEHEKTMSMLDKLADCMHKSKESKMAIQYYEKVLRNRQNNFAPSDKRILTALEKMVMVYLDANDLEKSLYYSRAVYDFLSEYQPADLGLNANIVLMENMVSLYSRLGKPKEAIEFQKKIHSLRPDKKKNINNIEDPDPDTLEELEQMAYNEKRMGNTKKALELYQKLLDIYEVKNGKRKQIDNSAADDDDDYDDENTFRIQSQMSLLLADPSNEHDPASKEQALKLLMRLYRYSKKNSGRDAKGTILFLGEAGRMHMELGRPNRALEIFKQVYKLQSRTLGSDHEQTLETVIEMANCNYQLHNFEEATNLRQKVYEANVKSLGKEHLDTIVSEREVVMTNAMVPGKTKSSIKMMKQIQDKLKNKFGANHEETVKTERILQHLKQIPDLLNMKDEL